MQAVLRQYSGKGAVELFDLLQQHQADLQPIMRGIKGFVSYTLARTGGGGFSVTVCQDKAGIDESNQKSKEWIAKNAANLGAAAPVVSVGEVALHIK